MATPAGGASGTPGPAHYFSRSPTTPSQRREVPVVLPDITLSLMTDRGVFSADRLDPGTRLLLLEAPPVSPTDVAPESTGTRPRLLDLGCGWGAIAVVAALRYPDAEVWAVDVNDRARTLTAENAARAGAAVEVRAPDRVDPSITFDRILSNPPVRIGKQALHEMLGHWLDRLAENGRAHLVVQRHLGSDSLARWLQQRGHGVERLLSRGGYRLLEVSARPVEDR